MQFEGGDSLPCLTCASNARVAVFPDRIPKKVCLFLAITAVFISRMSFNGFEKQILIFLMIFLNMSASIVFQ